MHFNYVPVGGSFVGGVSPRVGVQVDETEDEGVHEKCDTFGEHGARRCEKIRFRLAQADSHLNIIRIYVTWSIPVPFTYLVSSSVADINKRPPATRNCIAGIKTCASSNWRGRPTYERGEISKGSQRRDFAACWCLPGNFVVGIISPMAWGRVLVRDEAHLNDTGNPRDSQGVAKHCVDHRGEHQGLSMPTERPTSNNNTENGL